MKKFFSLFFASVLLIGALTSCNSDGGNESDALSSNSMNAPSAAPSTSIAPEITEDELYDIFKLVFEDCGNSSSQNEEQITAELAALKEVANADSTVWSKDYENLYKSWRSDTIAEQIAALKTEYSEIIASRERYTPSYQSGQDTKPGLFYANYLDVNDNGMPELILLTWPDVDYPDFIVLEAYQEEEGHAVKCFEQEIPLNIQGTNFELISSNQNIYLQASTYEMHQGSEYREYRIFGMDGDHFGLVNYLTYESTVKDLFVEPYEYEISCRSINPDGSYAELTADQYQTILGGFDGGQAIADAGNYGPNVYDTGILLPLQRTPAQVEVNGRLMEFGVEAYAYGGNLMAPLRDVLEAMGVAVYANSDVSVILFSTKNDTLTIANRDFSRSVIDTKEGWGQEYGNYKYSFNGNEFTDMSVQTFEGKLFGPIQIIAPLFGAQTEWDNETKTMRITGSVPADTKMEQSELQEMASFDLDQAVQIAKQNGYWYWSIGAQSADNSLGQLTGGLVFKNGRAVWTIFVVESGYGWGDESWKDIPGFEYIEGYRGVYVNLFQVDVANSGMVTAYPDVKGWEGAGAG